MTTTARGATAPPSTRDGVAPERPSDPRTGGAVARGWRRALARAWRPVSWRREVHRAVAVAAVLLVAAAFGVATASADGNLGPHAARYEVTLDHRVTVDLGPLGTLVVGSPAPLTLGARVTVQEIPRELTEVRTAFTLDELGEDLDRYVQLFSAPEATLRTAVDALVADAVRRGALAALVLGGVVLAVRAALGPARRAELSASARRHAPLLVAGATLPVLLTLTTTSGGTVLPARPSPGPPSAVFDGTPLEGAVITGRLAGVVDTYGSRVVTAYRQNEAFYDRAAAGVRTAWDRQRVVDAGVLAAREAAGITPVPEEATVSAVVVSDLHCNVGMARVIRAVVEESGAELVLNAGDTTMNGTAVETYCITAFDQALPADVTTVVADGNHDSADIAAHERSLGWAVLDGEPVDVAGIRVLGDADVRTTRVGVGTQQAGEESIADAAARLADVACTDGDVDLLLVHDPRMGRQALERGCVPAQVSGHYHRRVGPEREVGGVRYVNSSTAGAVSGEPTVGPLNGVAEITVLRFSRETGEVLDHRLVRVLPDGEVTVGFALRWPGPLPPAPEPLDPRAPR
ncbi:metallophosphoesterase family protein [Actinotalea sp. Marseille-Q4924]|uniref:metallophosphoesterase family protein n=1 Tax=Actinotalea sp. Marseille-Q4924 TaxID=2866571 RepID=UPI001CE43137|nr:metallophosphoesterase [Actinotalea sp. Marseille-Q4924]